VRSSIGKPFKLRPSQILQLNRVAITGLSDFPGVYRPHEIVIESSNHRPPPPELVPGYVEDMCEYVNDNLTLQAPIHLAAYLLWRLNWIHPFDDGNGRTARATSHAALCIALGYELPGTRTIPEQISEDKRPYYKALEAADAAQAKNKLDVSEVENLLQNMLAKQLVSVQEKATGKKLTL
jgi:Fic family protein